MNKIIPDEILDQHVAVLGKTGSGKSSAMRVLVEVCLLDQNKPFIGIDPKGDWWGLKSSASGKRAGFPIVIFGGLHADVPLNPRAGAHVAELLATGNRPAIVDLSQMLTGERTRFFIDFAESLFRHTRGKRWLMIDEVHNFAPKGKIFDVDAGKMLHWANRLASEGRGKGIQLLVASQRPQKVHNDLLDSCETLIAMRSVHPRAREAIKEWVDGAGDPQNGAAILNGLAKMPRGTGWVWSPEIGFGPKQVTFPMFRTFDSFKPQLHGSDKRLQGWASVDLKEVREKLADVVKEHEANDPRLLKLEIAELKKKLAKRVPFEVVDATATKGALTAEYDRGTRDGRADLAHHLLMEFETIEKTAISTTDRLRQIKARGDAKAETVRPASPAAASRPSRVTPAHVKYLPKSAAGSAPAGRLTHKDELLKKPQRLFLTALAQHGKPLTRNQIAIFAGYSVTSSHVDNTLSSLRVSGYVNGGPSAIEITNAGAAALGMFDPLPVGNDLRDYWIRQLSKPCAKFLEVITLAHPRAMSRDEIAEEAGYSKSSSHVDNTLSHLRTRGLITGPRGAIVASDDLFG